MLREAGLDLASPFSDHISHVVNAVQRADFFAASPCVASSGRLPLQYFVFIPLACALIAMHLLTGGVTIAYALPAYCALALSGLAALWWSGAQQCALNRHRCVFSALVLAAFVMARAIFSPIEYLARADLLMMLGALIVYLITAIHLTTSRQRLAVVGVLGLVALAQVAIGCMQFRRGDDWMFLPWIFRSPFFFRASGMYLNPNHLSGFLEMVTMLLLSMCFWARGHLVVRVAAGYGAAACLGGIILSGSRAGYASTFVAAFVFVVITILGLKRLSWRDFRTKAMVLVTGLLGVMFVTFYLMFLSEVLASRFESLFSSVGGRVLHWPAALQQFQTNPILGAGSGTYLIFGRRFRSHSVGDDIAHVHNDYLELLAEYGIAGAAAMAVFLVLHGCAALSGLRSVLMRKFYRGSRTKSNEFALIAGAVSGASALVVHSIADSNLHVPANALVLAFLLGIIANPCAEAPPSPLLASRTWLRFLAPACSLVLLCLAGSHVIGESFHERANIAARRGDHAAAIAFTERALRHEKDIAPLYRVRGECQTRLAEGLALGPDREAALRAAVQSFQSGLKIFPQGSRIWLGLGRAYDDLGDFLDADDAYRRAFELEPNGADLYEAYSRHWRLQNEPDEAQKYIGKAELLRTQARGAGR